MKTKIVSYVGTNMADSRSVEHIEHISVTLAADVLQGTTPGNNPSFANLIIMRDSDQNIGVYHPAVNERLVWWFDGVYEVQDAVERYNDLMDDLDKDAHSPGPSTMTERIVNPSADDEHAYNPRNKRPPSFLRSGRFA